MSAVSQALWVPGFISALTQGRRCRWPKWPALLFFQLPYLIDGTHKLTQSNAILRHIALKHNMCEWAWGWGQGHRWPWPGLDWGGMLRVSLLCGHRWGDRGGEDSSGLTGEPGYGCPLAHGQDLLQPWLCESFHIGLDKVWNAGHGPLHWRILGKTPASSGWKFSS